jgi:hypothetical protein
VEALYIPREQHLMLVYDPRDLRVEHVYFTHEEARGLENGELM